ncbi:unnamed protein product, partial [Gulo gulo]
MWRRPRATVRGPKRGLHPRFPFRRPPGRAPLPRPDLVRPGPGGRTREATATGSRPRAP